MTLKRTQSSSRAARRRALSLPLLPLLLLAACAKTTSTTAPSTQVGAVMSVTPDTGLVSVATEAGVAAPSSSSFTVENTGDQALDWSARQTDAWVLLSSDAGHLEAGEIEIVDVTLDQAQVGVLVAGIYPAVVDFFNDTNGVGTTSRQFELDIRPLAQPLSVDPPEGANFAGPVGGPFTPSVKTYTLMNAGLGPIDWSSIANAPWLTVTPSSGILAPLSQVVVSIAPDQTQAASLALGTFSGSVAFSNITDGTTLSGPGVGLSVIASGGGVVASSVSRAGITWTFDADYEVGQFANGDFWVVGPLTIIEIDPPSQFAAAEWIISGSSVNPSPRATAQGYDSTMFGQYVSAGSYDPGLNVGFGVSSSAPLLVPPHSSLVSTISQDEPSQRPQLRSAAVLTVLPEAPAPGSFRPAYCGSDKTIRFNQSQLDYSRLARLAPTHSTPSIEEVEEMFERTWIDHVSQWIGEYAHPTENMPNYGREIADEVGWASLMLHLDLPDSEKQVLLTRFVQLGIDLFGILEDGGQGRWDANGGHHSGRKWPILFAGIMLNDQAMGSIGFDPTLTFAEDDQTFYVRQTSPGVYNGGNGGYGSQHVGLAEWGVRHAVDPSRDNSEWFGDPYRICCTANVWWGQLLAARIMGAQALWNHAALFDYQDRYAMMAPSTGQAPWSISWTAFPSEMWAAYRDQY